MILYRTQPRTSEQNTIVDLETKETMMSTIRDGIPKFNGRVTKFSDITTLLTDASLVDGMLATSGYQNILVVTSFENNQYTQLRDRNYRPIKSAGDHLLPIVHSVNETHGNIYVAEPKMGSIFTPLYEKYDINIIPVDSCFKIDSTFKIKTDVKFDAVVLLGSESLQNGKFSATDVKAKFAKYCTEDFDMIDVYRGDTKTRNLKGGSKNKEQSINRLIECVNTPTRIYEVKERITPNFLGKIRNHRDRLVYFRLAINLETINEWYKVY